MARQEVLMNSVFIFDVVGYLAAELEYVYEEMEISVVRRNMAEWCLEDEDSIFFFSSFFSK